MKAVRREPLHRAAAAPTARRLSSRVASEIRGPDGLGMSCITADPDAKAGVIGLRPDCRRRWRSLAAARPGEPPSVAGAIGHVRKGGGAFTALGRSAP